MLLDDLRDFDLERLTLDDPDVRKLLDTIAVKAKARAQAGIAAERGTHAHELTEDFDTEVDIVARISRGEQLGLPPDVQRAIVAAWERAVQTFGFDILAVEATCVDDIWRQAGTLDRIVRLTRDLRFVLPTGEVVTLAAGWVGILDIKTGRLRLDDNGFVSYWSANAVQVASYAQSVPYDPDTDTRGEWPFTIDQRWAIIAHLDVLAALDGQATCRLVLVDLEAGRHAGALCVAAREWEKRSDVFSIVTDDNAVVVEVSCAEQSPGASAQELTAAPSAGTDVEQQPGGASAAPPGVIASEQASKNGRRAGVTASAEQADESTPQRDQQPLPPAPAQPSAPGDDAAARRRVQNCRSCDAPIIWAVTENGRRIPLDAELAANGNLVLVDGVASTPGLNDTIAGGLYVSHFATCPDAETHRRRAVQANQLATQGREGEPADERAVAALQRRYKALPADAKAWVDQLVSEGKAAGVPWNPGGQHSTRRLSLGRAIVRLAEHQFSGYGYATTIDLVRGLLGLATGRDEVEQDSLPLGAAIGSLDAAEAARLIVAVDDYLALSATA